MKIKKLLKEWTLLIAMFLGILLAVSFDTIAPLAAHKHEFDYMSATLMPIFMFTMLFLSFTTISPKDLKFKGWHLLNVLFQLACAVGFMFLLRPFSREMASVLFLCFMCPTAVASSVITDKLGGNVATLVTYVLLVNCVVSVSFPLFLPFVSSQYDTSFLFMVWQIMKKVFPLLVIPIAAAWLIRFLMPKLHAFLYKIRWISFYIWATSLVLLIEGIIDAVFADGMLSLEECAITGLSLFSCIVQFLFGWLSGKKFGDKISAGQALGQKNTIFAIWLASTFMNPVVSLAPGSYILWQNIINSIELRNSARKN